MQMLWVGCLESEEEFRIKAKKGYNLASAQVSQQNLIKGIEQIRDITIDSINGSVLPPYPVYADRVINPIIWSHRPGAVDISVGYKNDKYINRINCKQSMLQAAENWVKYRYQGDELIVLAYSMRSAPMATACRIKELIPKSRNYLIITDLPQFMDLGQRKLKALLKKIDWISIKKMQKQFDGFILYSTKMAEFLNIPKERWVLMEGSYDNAETLGPKSANNQTKAIMYSGKLDSQYGIDLLLDSFMSIRDSDIELWLTGAGNAEYYINECAEKDKRIKFYGFLPSRAEVLKLQQKASLLINMRLPSEEASNYCFPSKLFEYMATGIPVMSFRLGGIPEEYYEYLIMIDNPATLKQAIENALSSPKSNRKAIGENARAFILNRKTSANQANRVLNWIEGDVEI